MNDITHAFNFDIDKYRVKPQSNVALTDWDTNENEGLTKKVGRAATKDLNDRLEVLQELLWAESKNKVLTVLQATDTGGKDGTIRHVFDGVNPQGVKVASFKKPSTKELAHDYLWRIHSRTPGTGEITIFNRSHYEDVLVVRVHNLVPEQQWSKRYEHIRNFEKLLTDEGTTVVKIFLHLSKAEQKLRLQSRLDEADKHWKFSKSDLAEREYWDDYQKAFTDMVNETSTLNAPWYVVPADRKWFRNLLVSRIMVSVLESLSMSYPEAEPHLDNIVIPD